MTPNEKMVRDALTKLVSASKNIVGQEGDRIQEGLFDPFAEAYDQAKAVLEETRENAQEYVIELEPGLWVISGETGLCKRGIWSTRNISEAYIYNSEEAESDLAFWKGHAGGYPLARLVPVADNGGDSCHNSD